MMWCSKNSLFDAIITSSRLYFNRVFLATGLLSTNSFRVLAAKSRASYLPVRVVKIERRRSMQSGASATEAQIAASERRGEARSGATS